MPKTVVYKRSASKSTKASSSSKKSSPRVVAKKKSWNPLKWFLVAAVVAAVPITIALSQNSLDIRQHASTVNPDLCRQLDVNKDGKVDILDYNIVMADLGQTGKGLRSDVNYDGKVDIQDANMIKAMLDNSGGCVVAGATSTPSPIACSNGDYNQDKIVDIRDYNILAANLNSTDLKYDFNKDGVINDADLIALKTCFVDSPSNTPGIQPTTTCKTGVIQVVPSDPCSDLNTYRKALVYCYGGKEQVSSDSCLTKDTWAKKAEQVCTGKKACDNNQSNTAPVVTITTPTNGSTISKYAAIKISATATHPSGIKEITLEDGLTGKVIARCVNTTICTAYWSPKSGSQRVIAAATAKEYPYIGGQTEVTFVRP